MNGKRIVVTRPPHKAGDFAVKLREKGAVPVLIPTIAVEPVPDSAPLDAALADLAAYDWAIFTSANTVRMVWQRCQALGIKPHFRHVAAVGKATAKALHKHDVRVDLVPDDHVAEALFAAMQAQIELAGTRIFLPQGNLARPVLLDSLRSAGAEVNAVVAYHTVSPEVDPNILAGGFDAVTFTSSSTVTNFLTLFDDPLAVIGDALVACIGPVTAETAQEAGLTVHVVARPHTVDGLIAGLAHEFERTPHV